MTKPTSLIPYGGVTPLAIAQQLLERVRTAPGECFVVTCCIEKNKRGNFEYTCTNTGMPFEMAIAAGHVIQKHLERE